MKSPLFLHVKDLEPTDAGIKRVVDMKDAIPLLNCFPTFEGLRDGIVVRFRCMIQDIMENVMKSQRFGETDLRFVKDFELIEEDLGAVLSSELYDVDRYTAVSIPGESAYQVIARENLEPLFAPRMFTGKVTSSEESDPPQLVPADETCGRCPVVSPHPVPGGLRRVSAILNYPAPTAEFKMHEAVEVVGVLYNHKGDDATLPAVNFSIEVVSMEAIATAIPRSLTDEEVRVARCALKSVLTKLMLNDSLAAEYLILLLISDRIPVTDLGSWSLNFSNSDLINIELLTEFIRSISTNPLISLTASNEVLLRDKFYPLKSAESNFTHPGILQLVRGSTVLLDERQLKEGNVNALNVLAITKAVREQKLMAIFGSSDIIDFDLKARFAIFSSGTQESLFSNTNPMHGVPGSIPFLNMPILDARSSDRPLLPHDILLSETDHRLLQDYILFCRCLVSKVVITEDLINRFQDDWVKSRQLDESIPQKDIELWATFLRSFPASWGATETSQENWNSVLELEADRRSRSRPSDKPKTQIENLVVTDA